jgi:thiamine transport system substrate-binding protein
MLLRFLVFLPCVLVLCVSIISNASEKSLTIYSTTTFANNWTNTEHHFKKTFESECNCKVEFITFNSTGSMLSRLAIEKNGSKADLVIGFDANMRDKAELCDLFAPHDIIVDNLVLPIEWKDKHFIPYDYSYLAFIYNSKKLKNPPKSFKELVANPQIKVLIQDPRSSTLGLGLLAWVNLIYSKDETKEIWKKLKFNLVTVTRSWSESFVLFSRNEADMLLSYNSSPFYYMTNENDYDIKAAPFEEGHYLQIELVGKLKSSKNSDLANKFMNFVLSHDFQHSIPINNFMFPVVDLGDDLPKEYKFLFTPKKALISSEAQMKENRKIWTDQWLQALSGN